MYVSQNSKYRLRSSVALTYSEGILNAFKTNTRENIRIEINYNNVIDLLMEFDGSKSVSQISSKYSIKPVNFLKFVNLLNSKNILIEDDQAYPEYYIENNYRLINLLEDYCNKTSQVVKKISDSNKKVVLIIGLGGVGTWIIDTLARNGVKNFIIVDHDTVDLTNIHRQNFFFEDDIGKFKVDCVEESLHNISNDIKISKIYEKVDENFFNIHKLSCDLIINCADEPSVDYTTKIISDYGMKTNTPHIVGGGYNLHLTLIGQTVIPYRSACYKCFENALNEINKGNTLGLKKLNQKSRKIGSFPPLTTMSASISSLDAFKILFGLEHFVTNSSKRIEFRLRDLDFDIIDIPQDSNCPVCSRYFI